MMRAFCSLISFHIQTILYVDVSSIGLHMRLVRMLLLPIVMMVGASIPAWSAELVMVDQKGCHYCEKWDAEIGPIYAKTQEGLRAPLRKVNIRNLPTDIVFSSRPVFTPTFVLVEDGEELGRVEGYAGEDFFWFLIGQLLDAHPNATVPQL